MYLTDSEILSKSVNVFLGGDPGSLLFMRFNPLGFGRCLLVCWVGTGVATYHRLLLREILVYFSCLLQVACRV